MHVQCKRCNVKLSCHRTASLMINHSSIKHKEKTVERDNRQSIITPLAGSVGTCRCDVTRTEKISQPIKKLVTGDMLQLSFVEGACSHERMPFEPELSQASNYESGEDV